MVQGSYRPPLNKKSHIPAEHGYGLLFGDISYKSLFGLPQAGIGYGEMMIGKPDSMNFINEPVIAVRKNFIYSAALLKVNLISWFDADDFNRARKSDQIPPETMDQKAGS